MASSYRNTDTDTTQEVLFPNATPFSLDNYKNKSYQQDGFTVENDEGLDKAMAALMTEYAKENVNKDAFGTLTGTSLNLNTLQGDLINYARYDTNKNPIQPFTELYQERDNKIGIVSYKEGLTNDPSSSSSSSSTVTTTTSGTTSAGKSQRLLDLEKKLSELTSEYTSQYRLYTDDLLTRSRFLQINSQYLNKLVRDISYSGPDASAAFYFVNSFGHTHRYKDISSVLHYDNKTCPTIARDEFLSSDDKRNPFKITPASFIDISGGSAGGGFSKFSDLESYDMAKYGPCITTRNIKLPGVSSSEDVYAWVDAEGKKHIYEKGIWPDKRHSSCMTSVVGEPLSLTANQYNAIPTAVETPMKENSECFRASVAPSINSKLVDIKKKIDETVSEIKKENQNILNSVANTTIIQREKTFAEKWASLDDDILDKVKKVLGDYYYPAVYVFWCFIIFVAILWIFKFAFMFVSPGGGGDSSNGGEEGNGSGGGVSLLGVVIMALIVIFAVYYYFSYTYNLDVDITRNDSDTVYTAI
jgi:hypothetical protein